MVVSESRLVKAVIAEASFVNPPCAGHKGPVLAKNLGARVNLREPLRLQLARIGNGAGIVAEEIQAAERVALAQAVIHFPNCIVGTHRVGQAEVDRTSWIGAIVQREATAVA